MYEKTTRMYEKSTYIWQRFCAWSIHSTLRLHFLRTMDLYHERSKLCRGENLSTTEVGIMVKASSPPGERPAKSNQIYIESSQNMRYNERLITLNLLLLKYRRQISNLLLFLKSRNGLTSIDISNYLRTFASPFCTRNYDLKKITTSRQSRHLLM